MTVSIGEGGNCDDGHGYDNGDCDGIEPIATKRDSREAYHNSVDFVNYLLDYQYKYDLK